MTQLTNRGSVNWLVNIKIKKVKKSIIPYIVIASFVKR